MRKIIHIDMDIFFTSVEQGGDSELRGKPIAVGFDGPRGVVSTASYEARPFGVHSAMSMAQAKRRYPQLIVVFSHSGRYKEVSRQIHAVFHEYADLAEPISLGGAFLDVSENKKGVDLAVNIVKEIKQKILERTSLTASAGTSYNRLLAKIVSDMHKPDGIFTVHPDRALGFIDRLPVEGLWGVSPKTAERMHGMGIFTGKQLRETSREHPVQVSGKMGNVYYNFSRGTDNRPVIVSYERKSVGYEHTFLENLHVELKMIIGLYYITLELVGQVRAKDFKGGTLTLKLKWDAITQVTRSPTQDKIFRAKDDILPLARQLLKDTDYHNRPIRLMGLSVSLSETDGEEGQIRSQWIEGLFPFEKNDFAT